MRDNVSPPALTPPLQLRADGVITPIATLDEALLFAERHPLQQGDYPGLIRRLQSAGEPEDMVEAANAFRWWAEANGLLVGD